MTARYWLGVFASAAALFAGLLVVAPLLVLVQP